MPTHHPLGGAFYQHSLGQAFIGTNRRSPNLRSKTTVGSPSFAQQNTAVTNDMAPDGTQWAQGHPIIVDQFGRLIEATQKNGGGTKVNGFTYSNDAGATWVDSGVAEGFLLRPSMALDTTHDIIHVLWDALNVSDGIIYRSYTITRDVNNNITAITRVIATNLVMDNNASEYQHPILMWLNDAAYGTYGALVAIWSAYVSGSTGGTEIRSSMCTLGSTAGAGSLAGNWAATVTSATTTIGQSPVVTYSTLFSAGSTAANAAYPSAARVPGGTNANDIMLCFFDPTTGAKAWRYRRMQWNAGSNNWSTGLTASTLITLVAASGTDTGYANKQQLGSDVTFDVNNDAYFGYPYWASNVLGDTQAFVQIAPNGTQTKVNLYSANGAHSYAPTLDVRFITANNRLVCLYDKTTTNATYVQLFNTNAVQTQAETLVFNSVGVDIPLIVPSTLVNKLGVVFRDIVNTPTPPYHGWFGTMLWS